MFVSTNRTGVILVDGNTTGRRYFYPIYCSVPFIEYTGMVSDADDGYLVYPGWGFKLYNKENYSTAEPYSYTYFNSSEVPVLFSLYNANYKVFPNATGTVLIDPDAGGGYYQVNTTTSIKIYFRSISNEITIAGISN